jgi:hypothetical protein
MDGSDDRSPKVAQGQPRLQGCGDVPGRRALFMSTNEIIRGGMSNVMVGNMYLRYFPDRNGGQQLAVTFVKTLAMYGVAACRCAIQTDHRRRRSRAK